MEAEIQPKTAQGRISLLHVGVVALSVLMTLSVWLFSERQIETRIKARFDIGRDRALGLIVDRMAKYEDALWAGVSATESHGGDMSLEQWRIFANTLRIEEKYPGINGIGVIHYLTPDRVPDYMAERLAERPAYMIHPAHGQEILMPISFIEPEAGNAAAVGLDVAHETNRRTAALASRDTGTSQITGPIVLVQDAGSTPGFLFYAPYYAGGPQDTVADRRDKMLGIVYAPFVVRKLMEGLLAKDLRDVRFSIEDDGQVIYDEHTSDDPLNDPDPMFSETVQLDLYGRVWTVNMRTNLAFRKSNTFAQPTVILVGGLLIEALIIALLVMMSRANRSAVAYADRATAALRQEKSKLAETNAQLAKTNEELEQFAYITSHDLKTPIRGIGSLADMLKEDLHDYMAEPDANPEVREHLDLIQDRVARMNALTQGIMEFSKVGQHSFGDADLNLADTIETLRSDLGLRPDQLILSGQVDSLRYDSLMFLRILENLVGNAIKHHPDPQKAVVRVKVDKERDRYTVSVSDNGSGIEPRYHSKIFAVFQTLRAGDTPESTGIGLAIVKKAVERHGFAVTVVSEPGKGATFNFDWPISARTSEIE